MLRFKLAWVALKNIGRAAGRDPIWALIACVTFPFRYGAFFVKFVVGLLVIILIPTFVIEYLAHNGTIERAGLIHQIASSVVIIFALLLVWRAITNALIDNFGNIAGETHGSARFATPKEMAPYSQKSSGLLIGRDPKSKKLLRYDGPSHLITMAPTRTGKGVGTLIPNLLTADRSIICIDPKGENAKIAGRAREQFGPVHVLDPFGATDTRTATFNPMDSLDPASLDLAEDAGTLADALVFDEPGMSGEAHWNEEAKALVAGLILQIVSHEPAARRTLMTLRENLTLAPDAFAALLKQMQASTAANGLVARAANRHLGKSDREAAGVLSAAQRHTHFLDSPRMHRVLDDSSFSFTDLKRKNATVFLVLPPDRLSTYSRWLRLIITESLLDMAREPAKPASPILYLLDEFAALGHLAAIERAMGLMAGYGVQLWPILQDIHQLRATYGQKAGTFLSNAGVLQVFGVNDHESACLISDLLGQETAVFQIMARALDAEATGITLSTHHVVRPLLTPDEVRNLSGDFELLFLAGQRPIIAQKLAYFTDPEFKGRFDRA